MFVYKVSCCLNISDFGLFLMKKLQPPEKCHPILSQQAPSQNLDPAKPPLFDNLVGGSTPLPPAEKRGVGGGGASY